MGYVWDREGLPRRMYFWAGVGIGKASRRMYFWGRPLPIFYIEYVRWHIVWPYILVDRKCFNNIGVGYRDAAV